PIALFIFLLIQHRTGAIDAVKSHQRSLQSGVHSTFTHSMSGANVMTLQLVAMYRVSCWWMASFTLLRRLLIVAMLTWIRSARVWVWLSAVNFSFLAFH